MIKKYRKKPVVIEAMKYIGSESRVKQYIPDEFIKWVVDYENANEILYIKTSEGDMKCSIGDYIIKGIAGEFYPIKENIFKMTYEEV